MMRLTQFFGRMCLRSPVLRGLLLRDAPAQRYATVPELCCFAISGMWNAKRALTLPSIGRPMMKKVPVVFFSADPLSAPPFGRDERLGLDEDLRGIQEKVRAAKHRDVLEFDVRPAARIDDLVQALHQTKPQIVHFSGHGRNEGILLVGPDGRTPHWVNADDLTELFTAFRDDICVVVLSACSTRSQAKAIADVVGCAIGTPAAIKDEAAIVFNAEFYRAIAFGESVQGACEKACAVLGVTELDEVRPELVVGPGVDASQLVLIPKPVLLGRWVAAGAVLLVATGLALAQVPGESGGIDVTG